MRARLNHAQTRSLLMREVRARYARYKMRFARCAHCREALKNFMIRQRDAVRDAQTRDRRSVMITAWRVRLSR